MAKEKQNQQKKLTERQKKFCKEYVLNGGNGTKAAIKAGYKESSAYSTANEILKYPEVKAYLRILYEEEDKDFIYTRSMSFKNLEKAQRMALDKVHIAVTKDGEVIETPQPDIAAFTKAEELKGKLNGLYVEKTETKTDLNINCMGTVKIGDKELSLKIGKDPKKAEE